MSPLARVLSQLINNGLEKFGRYYSSYRAFVVDNNDPKLLGKVQLNIPHLTGDKAHPYWAYPSSRFSGKDKGLHILPEKGDLVWVEFEYGSLKNPLWRWGHPTTGQIVVEDYKPELVWFKLAEGYKILIDKEKKELTIKDPFDQVFAMNERGISLVRNDKPIFLGKLDAAKEAAILGDTLVAELKKIIDKTSADVEDLNTITQNLITLFSTQATISTNTPTLLPLAAGYTAAVTTLTSQLASITENATSLELIKNELDKVKSEAVKLD